MTHKADIAEQLSTIIFNLAEIENFDPNIPLAELDLDPMELIEKLRAEFGVGIEKEQLEKDVRTLDDLTVIYEHALDAQEPEAALGDAASDAASKTQFSDGAGTKMLEWQREQEALGREIEAESAELESDLDDILLEATPEETERAQAQYRASDALEAAFDDDEKTQIFIPDPSGGLQDAIELRLQESIMLEPIQDAPVDENAPTQIFIPRKPTQPPVDVTASVDFDDGPTQIVPPEEQQRGNMSIADAVQSLAEEATQIFIHDKTTPQPADQVSDLDVSSMIEQARAVRAAAPQNAESEDVTQIVEPHDLNLPSASFGQPVETYEEEVTQIYRPGEAEQSAESEESTESSGWENEEKTQIYIPEYEDDAFVDGDGNIISEAGEEVASVAEDITQIFSPAVEDAPSMKDDFIIIDDEIEALTGEDKTQIFIPEDRTSQIEDEVLAETAAQAAADIDVPVEDELTDSAFTNAVESHFDEERTQIFLPERDVEELIDSDAMDDDALEVADDRTQIFIAGRDDIDEDAATGGTVAQDDVAKQLLEDQAQQFIAVEEEADGAATLSGAELTQIYVPRANDAGESGAVEEASDYFQEDAEPNLYEEDEVDELGWDAVEPQVTPEELDYQHPTFQPLTPYEYDLDSLPTAPSYSTARSYNGLLGQFELTESEAGVTLSAGQRGHLAELVESVRQKTSKSRLHAEQYMAVQAVPNSAESFHQLWQSISYPLVAARSKGSKIWDIDGNEYIDITLGGGAHFLGHAPDFVSGALSAEFAKGYELGIQSRYAGEVAKAICDYTNLDRVTFVDSSSSAVQLALRLARLKSGRSKVVMFAGSYHGDFAEGLAQAQVIDGKLATRAAIPGVADAAVQNVYVLEYDSAESLNFIRANADEIAAVVAEPVQRHYPMRQPRAFLHELRAITAQADIALVLDETLTGFRVHIGGIQQAWGIGADLVVYGSHLAAGLPIGVLAGARKWLDGVDGSAFDLDGKATPNAMRTYSGHQFARHPFAMAAANSVLKYMVARGGSLQQQMTAKTKRLAERLNAFFAEVNLPIQVQQFSSWFKFSIPYDLSYADLLTYHLRNNGIYVENIRQLNFLSIVHQEDEIDAIVEAVKQSVCELQQSRLFPANATTPFPLTEAQQSLWLAHQLGEDAALALNHSFALDFDGGIDAAVLADALEMVIRRHQSLHLQIAGAGDSQQYLNPKFSNSIAKHDLMSFTSEQQQERYWELVDEATLQPFALLGESSFRAQLIQFAPDHMRFVMTVHRLFFDGWSTTVLIDELRQLYNGLVGERTVFLPPPALFSDFVRVEEEIASSEGGQENMTSWVEALTPPPLQRGLPTDYDRKSTRADRAASLSIELDEIVIERAKAAAAVHETSFEVVLLTAYVSMLEQIAGQNDTVIGVPVAQQSLHDLPWLVGSAENLLPLRVQSSANASTATLLSLTELAVEQTMAQSGVTYGALLRALHMPRMLNRAPLFDTIFSFKNEPNTSGFADINVSYHQLAPTHTIFDLAWSIERGETHVVTVDYNRALFAEGTVIEWVQQFEAALEAIALEPVEENSAETSDAVLNSAVPEQWTSLNVHFPEDKTTLDLFAMQAKDTPNTVAVVAEDRSKLFYKGLNKKSNRLAHYIKAQDLAENALIGICMTRTSDTLTAILGTMKAGHGFVALDPAATPAQLEAIVADAQLGMIITQGDSFSGLNLEIADEVHVVFIDHHWLIMAHHSGGEINFATPDKIAYVSYRVDQNANVLGTVVSHAALSNALMSLMDKPGLSESDYFLNITPLSQSHGIIDMMLPLLMGARVILASDATINEPRRLAQVVDKAGISMLLATAEQLQQLFDDGWQGQIGLTVLCYGQPDQSLADALLDTCNAVWLLYGSAETANSGLIYEHTQESSVALGTPIANSSAFVLNDSLQPLPIGQPGDLYLGGKVLAERYLNNADLTADRFIANADVAGVLFKTEIQAAWHPNGYLTTSLEHIDIVADSGDEQSVEPNEPETNQGVVAYSFAPEKTQIILPMSQTEAVIADIWREALDRQTVDANANFFSLGGHSMLAMQVLLRIEEKLGARLSLNEFLAAPTVFALSQLIDSNE